MEPTVTLRSRASRALGLAMVAAALIGLVSLAWQDPEELLDLGAPVALFGVLGWASFWRPSVEVSDGGVRVVNTLRTVEVPWPALESVEGRYGLRLVTAYGPVSAWGVAAPAGRQRARGQQSNAATTVTDRLESLRAAGHLEDARLERPDLRSTWHWPTIATTAFLVAASVVLPMLG